MRLKQVKTGMHIFRSQGLAGIARVVLVKLAQKQSESPNTFGAKWPPFLNWLMYANAGMLGRGNVYCIDYAVRHLPPGSTIIEIGSFCGLSTNVITFMKEKYGVKNPLVTCDKWEFEGVDQGSMLGDSRTLSHADYRVFVKESYIRNIQMFSRYDLPYTIEAFSDAFFEAWAAGKRKTDVLGREITLGGPIGFCYIDGNHAYEYAKRDFVNADRFLEPGGFLLFDDSADGSGWDVCNVVAEVVETGRYDLVARNPNYFFRKKTP